MPTQMLKEGLSYLTSHPAFLFTAAKNAARMSLSIPLDLLRWGIDKRPRGKGPERIDLNAAQGGFNVGLTIDLYGTKIDVNSGLHIESIENAVDSLRIALRLKDLSVKAPPNSPAAMMLQSMDFTKPGNLVNLMPQRHNALVDVKDDLFVLDILKFGKLAENRTLRKVLSGLADVLSIREVRTEDDVLVIGLSVNPLALPSALARLRAG